MRIELIKAPRTEFLQILRGQVRAGEKEQLQGEQWGAVGLIQGALIELYWAMDQATKASTVRVALVGGTCPQQIQMLAVFGRQTDVQTALNKIREAHRQRRSLQGE